jgi:hypothetical protein
MLNFQRQVGAVPRGRAFLSVIVQSILQIFFDLLFAGLLFENDGADHGTNKATHDKDDQAKCVGQDDPHKHAKEQKAERYQKTMQISHGASNLISLALAGWFQPV